MVEPTTVIASLIIGSARKALVDPRISRSIDKRSAVKELEQAISYAVECTKEAFTQCFIRNKGPLDESFWQSSEIRQELWNTLIDSRKPERVPDFNILYEVYCEIYVELARIERPLFDKALGTFWTHFLDQARKSQLFSQFFKDKIIFQLDETVFPHEGQEMIIEYCRGMAKKLDDQTFHKFRPRELDKTGFSEEKVRKEFLDYRCTRLTYAPKNHDSAVRSGEEQAIEGNSFLVDKKIIFIGQGGVGKTRFMFELVKQLAAEIAKGSTEPLPLYFQASDFVGDTEDDLVKILKTRLRETLDLREHSDGKIKGFVRYLRMYGKLFPVIDAFDQIRPEQEQILFRLIASDALFGKCKTYLSARPYKLAQLLKGIDRQGSDSRKFRVIEIHPFKLDELPVFFKGYYDRIKPLIDKLEQRQEQEINLIQLPMFARLVKIMAIKGKFQQPETIADANRSSLMRQFVDFVVNEQSEKDKIPAQDKEEKRANYDTMLQKIEQLSLKTLEAGQIYTFDKEYAQDILGEESFRRYWPLMKRIEFIDKFFDYESKESLAEPKHRFQHQIFQEYFAAKGLCWLYRKSEGGPDRPEMRAAMEKMKYMPEVGQFFAELIEKEAQAEEFYFWQDLVTRNNREDWVRTYALQVRDKLGEHKAKDALSKLFDAENRRLAQSNHSSPMVHVPGGGFVRGSYEYENERPVSWVTLDNFDIDRHPVTNRQFMEFLKDHYKRNKSYKDTDDQEVIDSEYSKIKAMAEEVIIQEGYEDHPVVAATWHGAQSYCKWKSSLEHAEYRLPTEAEWEKAARGSLGRRYPWGNKFAGGKCNTFESQINGTSRIGSFPDGMSPHSCHDMAGNVWEWCQDDFQSDFYEKGTKKNPVCSEPGAGSKVLSSKMLLGGSWLYFRDLARFANRLRVNPDYGDNDIGFRCARTKK